MRILFIPTSYPNENSPTRNLFIREQAEALFKIGNEIRVLHVEKMSTKQVLLFCSKKCSKFNDNGIIRYHTKCKTFLENKFGFLNKHLFSNRMKLLFKIMIAEWKPDVIYAHFSNWAGDIAVELGELYDIPVVTIEHYSGYMQNTFSKYELNGLKKCILKSDRMLCVSDNFKKRILEISGIKKEITVLYNMVSPIFSYYPRFNSERFVFCAIGNLNKRKRFDLLIDSFCSAFGPDEDVELVIGGDGKEMDYLKELIKSKKRTTQIIMRGRVTREDTLELYKNCDVFVLPSAAETFGIVWREAMAVGRPIITTNHGGFDPSNWDDKIGYIIPIDDKNKLIESLRLIRKNISTYNGEYISQKCLSHYSEKAIVKQLMDIFDEVVKKRCKS